MSRINHLFSRTAVLATAVALHLGLHATGAFAAEPATTAAPPAPTVAAAAKPAAAAIFVRNLAGKNLAGHEQSFEDLVAARLATGDMRVLSRAEITDKLAPRPAIGAPAAPKPEPPPSPVAPAPAATALEDATSALNLARNIGADYILSLSLVSLEKDARRFTGYGVQTVNTEYTLRVAWKLLEVNQGGGILGGEAAATRVFRDTASLGEASSDVTPGLLSDAAGKVATAFHAQLVRRAEAVAAARATAADFVNFTVKISAENIFFPELIVAKDGTLRIKNPKSPVAVDAVVVELDGVVLGTVPAAGQAFKARPGLHKLRLSREGFKPWEGTVNLFDKFVFNAALELTEAGLQRWQTQAAFAQKLKNDAKLADAQIEVLKGEAAKLKASGYKVDIKVDADALPENTTVIR